MCGELYIPRPSAIKNYPPSASFRFYAVYSYSLDAPPECINEVFTCSFCISIHSMQVLTPYYTTLYTFLFITIR